MVCVYSGFLHVLIRYCLLRKDSCLLIGNFCIEKVVFLGIAIRCRRGGSLRGFVKILLTLAEWSRSKVKYYSAMCARNHVRWHHPTRVTFTLCLLHNLGTLKSIIYYWGSYFLQGQRTPTILFQFSLFSIMFESLS